MQGNHRVLIAEDDTASAELIQFVLEDMGCTVVAAVGSGNEAVSKVTELRPDLVIMDLSMPGMDGVEATRRIQEAVPTPVIVVTAFEAQQWVEKASAAGAAAYLVKPVTAKEVERAVAVALARFRDMMELRRLLVELRRAEEERRELAERVRQTQKLESLAALAGGIAHDFNNLLMGVLGNVELALLRLPVDSPARESLQRVVELTQEAAGLSRQMLGYAGHGHLLVVSVDMRSLVEQRAAELRTRLAPNVTLYFDLTEAVPTIRADAEQLLQLLDNLVVNGAEAIGQTRGRLRVTVGSAVCSQDELRRTHVDDHLPAGRYVTLRVADDGPGMDAETRERMFDPFFSTKFTGRGLGMPAVLGTVRAHRGAIAVESEPGHGTTVTVYLPCFEAQPAAETTATTPDAEWRGSGTVLVVDDEPAVLSVASTFLESLGFEVLTAADGPEGIAAFRRQADRIVLVLLDMVMPSMSGEAVFRELLQIRPDARVVLTSGYGEREATARLREKGLAGFIQKPYGLDALRETVRAALQA